MKVDETCGLSGCGVRQPIEQKKDVVPRTPKPTDGWLCSAPGVFIAAPDPCVTPTLGENHR